MWGREILDVTERSRNQKVQNSKPGIRNKNPGFEEFGMRNFLPRNQCPEICRPLLGIWQCLGQRDLWMWQRDPLNLKVQASKLENWVFSEASKLAMLRILDPEFRSAPWLRKKHSKCKKSRILRKSCPPQPPRSSDPARVQDDLPQ